MAFSSMRLTLVAFSSMNDGGIEETVTKQLAPVIKLQNGPRHNLNEVALFVSIS